MAASAGSISQTRGGGGNKDLFPNLLRHPTPYAKRKVCRSGESRPEMRAGGARPPEMTGKTSANPATIAPAAVPEMSGHWAGNRSAAKPPSHTEMDRESDGGRSRETGGAARRNGGGPLTEKRASGGSAAPRGCRRRPGRDAGRLPRPPRPPARGN